MSYESTYLKIAYPEEHQDPFYETYESQVNSTDEILFMQKIQNNLIIGGGGIISFSSITQQLTWTQDFIVPVFHYGKKITLSYGPDNATRVASILDGYALVIEIPYVLTDNITTNIKVLSQLTPLNHQQWVLGFRTGTKVYFKGLSPVGT